MPTLPNVRSPDRHVLVFRILAVLCSVAFLATGGIPSILVPWGSAGLPFTGFTPEMHRWHSALLGVSEAILIPGLLLSLLYRPRERPLLLQFLIIVGVGLVLPHFLIRGRTPVFSVFLVPPILAYPGLRSVFQFSSPGTRSNWLLAAGGIALVLLAPDLWRNLQAQLTGAGGEHAHHGHWATAFSLDLVLVAGVFLSATRRPGWRAVALICAGTFAYLGLAAIAIPNHAGSWGVANGIRALVGAGALAATVWLVGRTQPTTATG